MALGGVQRVRQGWKVDLWVQGQLERGVPPLLTQTGNEGFLQLLGGTSLAESHPKRDLGNIQPHPANWSEGGMPLTGECGS